MENPESKFQDLFKSKYKGDLQERRRKELLKEQKLQRSLLQDESRNFESNFPKPRGSTGRYKIKSRTFKNKYQIDHSLQFSEWLKEKPEDMNEWILVPCPKGQRCMVIACNGYTEMYNKYGRHLETFESLLPGNAGSNTDVTILDCVFVEGRRTFYVLDALAYGNHDLRNCEAQFRFFWLTSKFFESNFDEVSSKNVYSFVCLDFYDFQYPTRVSIGLKQYPLWDCDFPELDGFLFYHKEASYTCGSTPLVGWLFAFMVPEVLGYEVNSAYMDQKPDDYTDYINFMVSFDEEMAKRRLEHQKKQSSDRTSMDDDVSKEEEVCDDDNAFIKALLKAQMNLELEDESADIAENVENV